MHWHHAVKVAVTRVITFSLDAFPLRPHPQLLPPVSKTDRRNSWITINTVIILIFNVTARIKLCLNSYSTRANALPNILITSTFISIGKICKKNCTIESVVPFKSEFLPFYCMWWTWRFTGRCCDIWSLWANKIPSTNKHLISRIGIKLSVDLLFHEIY